MFLLLVGRVVRTGVEPAPATYQIAMLPLQHRTVFISCYRLRPSSSLSLGGMPCFRPDDFQSSSCGDRNRTCVVTVNSRLPVPARTPPQCFSVSVVGFEPTFSCARGTRISMLSHTLIIVHRRWTFVSRRTIHANKRTQRELNPHLRLGETVRCRYVMGA